MTSSFGGKRGGKPQVEIYRPGSGPLRKSANGDDEMFGDGSLNKMDKVFLERERRDGTDYSTPGVSKLSDDLDRLSVCSNNSRQNFRNERQSLSGSTGNLSDVRKRSKKPELAVYVPPKPSITLQSNQENKRYKSRNYSNSQRGDMIRREDSFKLEEDSRKDRDLGKFNNDVDYRKDSGKDGRNYWSDSRSQRGDSEPPPKRNNDRSRKSKKSKKRSGRGENRDENLNQVNGSADGKIISLMDIKFDCNPLESMPKTKRNYDITSYETSGYTTTDGESERDPLCSLRNAKSLPRRNFRQNSEPRSLPLSSQPDRGRDTRSVEPGDDSSWSRDKFNLKPPSGSYGRKNNKNSHSKHKQYHLSFESLPPRLQKKYMEDNGLQEPPIHCSYTSLSTEKGYLGSNPDLSYGCTDSEPSYSGTTTVTNTKSSYEEGNEPTTFIGTNSEDPWDGSSVTFQGTNPNTFYTNVPPPSMFTQPPPPIHCSQIPPPTVWSQTLPHTKTRGRGRVPYHQLEKERIAFAEATMTRSLTPDNLRVLEEPQFDRFEDNSLYQKLISEPCEEMRGLQNNVESHLKIISPKEKNLTYQETCNEPEHPLSEDSNASKHKSLVQSKSLQDLTFKKPSGTGMNWAEEVELSERLQETMEERESEENTFSLSASNMSPISQPTETAASGTTPHKERRRKKKRRRGKGQNDRSISRERQQNNDRRSSYDVDSVCNISRSRKNSGDDRHPPSRSRKNSGDDRNLASRSRKNSGDDRNWSRSRKNSVDDRNWRRDENRDPIQNYRSKNPADHRASSRNSSRNNSRNNSMERWTSEEYHHHNGSERKFRGHSGERFRRNSTKSYNNSSSDRHYNPRRRGSRDLSWDRNKELPRKEENWREEPRRINGPGAGVEPKKPQKPAGILVLPQSVSPQKEMESISLRNSSANHTQRQLFDPSNPNRPLIVNTQPDSGRVASYAPYGSAKSSEAQFALPNAPPVHILHPNLLTEAKVIDYELNHMLMSGSWYEYHDEITKRRGRLQEILWMLLTTDIKYCQQENMEQHFWKILYYNLLEWLRKQMGTAPAQSKDNFLGPLLNIIDEGMKFFENTLRVLGECYQFSLEEQLALGTTTVKGRNRPLITMALMSAQKILLFLGDLARYREQVQDTSNYGLARQWYIKAQQLNPKNGRPYNQLAILAVYARRKLDAVYYYMRSLTATISVASSKESLLTLFDENRKKFELIEKQRQEERELRDKEKMKEKECESKKGLQLRREIWIHPEGGRRVHRTTSASQPVFNDSEAELEALTHLDLSKRFSMSFLHVHGKLFTKIGMESFQGAALQMLKEFRALLQHSPLPLTTTRLLQLLALNMFSIDNTQLKNNELGPGYRSALQESALVTSLQMFSLVLERTVALLRDQRAETYRLLVSDDVNILLPAVKVWCDWLLCHSSVWNPPPSCHDYRVGPAGDVWGRLAALVNFLEKLDCKQELLSEKNLEGYEHVRLAEDSALAGFIPLMLNCPEPMFTSKENNMEVVQVSLRIHRILFCGTVFLCGVDPPVLKLHKDETTGDSEYISVVETPSPPAQSDGELCVESVSSGESEDSGQASEEEVEPGPSGSGGGGGEIQSLLMRKQQLERSHRRQQKQHEKVQSILQSSLVSVEIEVKPHYLVADTNCFIDYLPQLQIIAKASSPNKPHIYTIMVPLVVLNELDGLAHGRRDCSARPSHLAMVTECAAAALDYLRSKPSPAFRCVTTRGTVLSSLSFTSEEDQEEMKNDDKILTTCLRLCHTQTREQIEGEPRKITRDVVLLTEDRNLRVKALARDMPVREVPNFMQWAGLELG